MILDKCKFLVITFYLFVSFTAYGESKFAQTSDVIPVISKVHALTFADKKLSDCVLREAEASSVTYVHELKSLDCHSGEIKSAEGIEQLVNLESLNLSHNEISIIDLSSNLFLTKLNLGFNRLARISLEQNTHLKKLNLHYNQLSSIKLRRNRSLTELNLSYNKIDSIDISHNIALRSVNLEANNIESIDISSNVALKTLILAHNRLSYINISHKISL